MKRSRCDLAEGLLRKAQSDLDAAHACLAAERALDTVCFHAQQAAEKALKAYLTAGGVEYPFSHNLEKLVEICASVDASFGDIKSLGAGLTPYAVELRYDEEFWPSAPAAREAVEGAETIRDFVVSRLGMAEGGES